MNRMAVLVLVSMLSTPVIADSFDGSRRVVCTTEQLRDCIAGTECLSGLPDEYGAPTSLRLDFANRQILGERRKSKIRDLEKSKDQLLLQGRELGYGWTMAIDRQKGDMSLSLVNREGAFVLFGHCASL